MTHLAAIFLWLSWGGASRGARASSLAAGRGLDRLTAGLGISGETLWSGLLLAALAAAAVAWYRHVTRFPREGTRFVREAARVERETMFGPSAEARAEARRQLRALAERAHLTTNPYIKNRETARIMLEHLEHIAHSAVHLGDLSEDEAREWQEDVMRLVKPLLYFGAPRRRRQGRQEEANES